jgi:hypothetical protein
MVFDIKKSEIYVKRETANAMTGSWGAPPGDMLVQHPTSSSIVTCLDLHIAQAMIKRDGHESHAGMRYKNALGTDEFKMLDDIQKDCQKITNQPFTILQGPAEPVRLRSWLQS